MKHTDRANIQRTACQDIQRISICACRTEKYPMWCALSSDKVNGRVRFLCLALIRRLYAEKPHVTDQIIFQTFFFQQT